MIIKQTVALNKPSTDKQKHGITNLEVALQQANASLAATIVVTGQSRCTNKNYSKVMLSQGTPIIKTKATRGVTGIAKFKQPVIRKYYTRRFVYSLRQWCNKSMHQ